MTDFDTRTRLLIGRAGVARLRAAHVLLFGVGGGRAPGTASHSA